MTAFDYSGFAKTAESMIKDAGAEVTWQKPAAPAEGSDPWRDDRGNNEPPTFTPYMAFFSVIDAGRGGSRGFLLSLMKGTEVPDANEVGFLAGNCGFTPEMSDTLIMDNGDVREIVDIDKIDPTGKNPVIYFVSVK